MKETYTSYLAYIWFLVPSTTQLLILSPFTPKYTIHNSFLNISTTVTTINYDSKSIQKTIPPGTPAYVQNVTINGVPSSSRCHFDFYDAFRLGGDIIITLTANKTEADSCLGTLPDSLSTGGFTQARWSKFSRQDRLPPYHCHSLQILWTLVFKTSFLHSFAKKSDFIEILHRY